MRLFESLVNLVAGTKPKYVFLDKFFYFDGKPHKRIQAVRDFSITVCGKKLLIKKGDIGGFLPHDTHHPDLDGSFHLPHNDCSWISGNARCSELGHLRMDSLISGNALVTGRSEISMSYVGGNAIIDGSSEIIMNSEISNNARIIDAKCIHSSAIFGNTFIKGNVNITASCIYGDVKIIDDFPFGELWLTHSRVYGTTTLKVFSSKRSRHTLHDYEMYGSKNISECNISNDEQYNQSVKAGRIVDLGSIDCDYEDVSENYKKITRIYPIGRGKNYIISL